MNGVYDYFVYTQIFDDTEDNNTSDKTPTSEPPRIHRPDAQKHAADRLKSFSDIKPLPRRKTL